MHLNVVGVPNCDQSPMLQLNGMPSLPVLQEKEIGSTSLGKQCLQQENLQLKTDTIVCHHWAPVSQVVSHRDAG